MTHQSPPFLTPTLGGPLLGSQTTKTARLFTAIWRLRIEPKKRPDGRNVGMSETDGCSSWYTVAAMGGASQTDAMGRHDHPPGGRLAALRPTEPLVGRCFSQWSATRNDTRFKLECGLASRSTRPLELVSKTLESAGRRVGGLSAKQFGHIGEGPSPRCR